MKMLVRFLKLIGVVMVLLLLAALFIRNEYTVEREIIIGRPKGLVFDYLRHLKNQDHYNKFVMADPHMKKAFRGTDGAPGFIYAWEGNDKAGKGEQEIKRLEDGQRIDIEIRFEKPFKSVANVPLVTETVSLNKTRVKWAMQGRTPYPMNFMNLFIDRMLGKELESSLSMLKTILEKQ